jgi:hypothetical protein
MISLMHGLGNGNNLAVTLEHQAKPYATTAPEKSLPAEAILSWQSEHPPGAETAPPQTCDNSTL